MSARVRMLAAAGLVAVLALAGGFVLLGGGGSSPSAAPMIKPLHPVKHHVAAKKPAAPKAKPAAKRVAKPRQRSVRAVINGMPGALALALQSNNVVVAALYAPDSSVDTLAIAEAREGAQLAGAGFVALDVSNEKVAAPLTSLLTTGKTAADRVLDDPAILVFQAPRSLFVRFNGWTDRDTIAQAATNAGAVGSG